MVITKGCDLWATIRSLADLPGCDVFKAVMLSRSSKYLPHTDARAQEQSERPQRKRWCQRGPGSDLGPYLEELHRYFTSSLSSRHPRGDNVYWEDKL